MSEPQDDVKPQGKKRKGKSPGAFKLPKKATMTAARWAEAGALWETGEYTLKQLAERYQMSENGMHLGLKQRGFEKGAKSPAVQQAVQQAVESEAVDQATVIAQRIRETREDHYQAAKYIAKLTLNALVARQKGQESIANATPELKALRHAMAVLQMARAERWIILGLDREDGDDETLPELIVKELSREEAQTLASAQAAMGDDMADLLADLEDPEGLEGIDDALDAEDGDDGGS